MVPKVSLSCTCTHVYTHNVFFIFPFVLHIPPMSISPSKLAREVRSLTWIMEVPRSNLGQDTTYTHWCLSWPSSVLPRKFRKYLEMGYNRFLSHPFQSIIINLHTIWCYRPRVGATDIQGGIISIWLYKENKLWDLKNVFTYSPWAAHTSLF
jgi:hypothetical protein